MRPPGTLGLLRHAPQDNGLKLSNSWAGGYYVLLNPPFTAQVGQTCSPSRITRPGLQRESLCLPCFVAQGCRTKAGSHPVCRFSGGSSTGADQAYVLGACQLLPWLVCWDMVATCPPSLRCQFCCRCIDEVENGEVCAGPVGPGAYSPHHLVCQQPVSAAALDARVRLCVGGMGGRGEPLVLWVGCVCDNACTTGQQDAPSSRRCPPPSSSAATPPTPPTSSGCGPTPGCCCGACRPGSRTMTRREAHSWTFHMGPFSGKGF